MKYITGFCAFLKGGVAGMEKRDKGKIKYNSRAKIIQKSEEFDHLIKNNNIEVGNGENPIVLLTEENAKIIENLIENDDDYFPFSKVIFDYYGINKIKDNTDKSLFAVVREIDRDNNTNVWRYKKNRNNFHNMILYIMNPTSNFWGRLESGDIKLPDEIVSQCGTGLKSLSSKICKYLSEFAFKKDNYYINDSYIRAMLLFYLDYYGVEHSELKSIEKANNLTYTELYCWLKKLHNARDNKHNDKITKSELDHILWYCYKSFNL